MVEEYKNALEMLWRGLCTIVVREEKQNETNKRTEFEERELYTNQPCKLSFTTIKQTDEYNNVAEVTQIVKLFISNEIDIPAGSKIIVTQNGRTTTYRRSGEPAVYTYHQEVPLELFERWA